MEDAHPTASVSSDTDAEHYPIELGTRIADTAILQETDGTVSWLTANRSDTMAADKTVDERYEPGAPTSGLYDGMAGTGMFAAELYRRTHDERWRDLCTRMMRSLMRRKDRGITYSGFTSGLSRSYCALRMANAGITSPEARRWHDADGSYAAGIHRRYAAEAPAARQSSTVIPSGLPDRGGQFDHAVSAAVRRIP